MHTALAQLLRTDAVSHGFVAELDSARGISEAFAAN
jgi:hypothetical protein